MSELILPPDSHWCQSPYCEEGVDTDHEDYPTVCSECDGRGFNKCEDDLDCTEHNPTRPEGTEIEVGQVWRRNKGGKLILITWQVIGYSGNPVNDWDWGGYDYEGTGQILGVSLIHRYTLEMEAVDE
jgi:hypothetical protein